MLGGKLLFGGALVVLMFQLLIITPEVRVAPSFEFGEITSAALISDINQFPNLLWSAQLALHDNSEYDSVVFTGDLMLARHVEVLMSRHGQDYPFDSIKLDVMSKKPAVVGNFESAMALKHTPTPAGKLRFSTNQVYLSALSRAGFTHLSLANNHSLDYGQAGYVYTEESLLENNLEPFGFIPKDNGEVATYLETTAGTVAVIGFNDSDWGLNLARAAAEIQELAGKSDLQIVYIHWGEEYQLTHSSRQEEIAQILVESGADLIVGHHPHVVQDVGVITGVPVFYSLGNYIFDQYFSTSVQEGLVLQLNFNPLPSVSLIPVSSIGTFSKPRALTGEDKAEFLYKLAIRSAPEFQETISRGFVPLHEVVASSTKMAMMF